MRDFKAERAAIRAAMAAGTIGVDDALAQIRALMRAELKAFGLTTCGENGTGA
jgi:hypothetical protein